MGVWMGCRQMGQSEEVRGLGGGTVKMGRWVADEIGGEGFGDGEVVVGLVEGGVDAGLEAGVEVEEESDTVFGTDGNFIVGEAFGTDT